MSNFQNTPQNVDLFTRYMMEGFDEHEHIAVSTVWLPFFGDAKYGGRTLFSPDRNAVDIDIKKANEKYAKMRLRGEGGPQTIGSNIKGLKSEKFTSITRKYPLMEDFFPITAEQLNWRSFGQSADAPGDKQSRFRRLALAGSNEIIRRFVRSFNLLAGESVLEGQQSAIFGTTKTDLIYDFYRNPNLTFTVANAWDTGTGTVLADLDEACRRVQIYGKTRPSAFFTKGSVLNAMVENTNFSNLADNLRFNLIGIGSSDKMGANQVSTMPSSYQKFIDSGWNYRGWVETPEGYTLNIFTTPDYVQEDDDTLTDMVPDGWGLVCNPFVRCDRHFGPDEWLPPTSSKIAFYNETLGFNLLAPPLPGKIKGSSDLVRPDMFSYNAFENENHTNFTIEVQSAPIFVTTHTDAFCTLKGMTS